MDDQQLRQKCYEQQRRIVENTKHISYLKNKLKQAGEAEGRNLWQKYEKYKTIVKAYGAEDVVTLALDAVLSGMPLNKLCYEFCSTQFKFYTAERFSGRYDRYWSGNPAQHTTGRHSQAYPASMKAFAQIMFNIGGEKMVSLMRGNVGDEYKQTQSPSDFQGKYPKQMKKVKY